jgi:hypothetical protein
LALGVLHSLHGTVERIALSQHAGGQQAQRRLQPRCFCVFQTVHPDDEPERNCHDPYESRGHPPHAQVDGNRLVVHCHSTGTLHWIALPVQQDIGKVLQRPATSGREDPNASYDWLLAMLGIPDRFPLRCAPPQETSIPRPYTGLIIQPTALPPTLTLISAAGNQTIARGKDAACERARPLYHAPNRSMIDSAG